MNRQEYKKKIKEWEKNKNINCPYCDAKKKCSICEKKVATFYQKGKLIYCFNCYVNNEEI